MGSHNHNRAFSGGSHNHARTISDSSFGDFTAAPSADAPFSPILDPPLVPVPDSGDASASGFSDFVAAPGPANPSDPSWGFFETALPSPPAPPSPPIRDLRPVEARLRLRERNETLDPAKEHHDTPYLSAGLYGDQLEDNEHAQSSRLPILPLQAPAARPEQAQALPGRTMAEPTGFAGSLWRTFGNLNLRQLPRPHLPAGLFDMANDDPEFQAYQRTLPVSGPSKGPSPSLSPGPSRYRTQSSTELPKAVPIISGAPGFNVTQDRFDNQHWNKGGWTLPSTTTTTPSGTSTPSMSSRDVSGVQNRSPMPSAPSMAPPAADPLDRVRVLTGATPQAAAESRFAHRRAQTVKLHGRYADTRKVVRPLLAGQLQAVLPARLQLGRGWRLIYSTDQHGISLQTLYDRVSRSMSQSSVTRSAAREGWLRGASSDAASALAADEDEGVSSLTTSATLGEATQAAAQATDKMSRSGLAMHDAGLILAVQDADGNVFGAFLNEPIKPQPHYFGTGQFFLWKTVKLPGRTSEEGMVEAGRILKLFPWSGRNMYACLAQSSSLAFGGGPDGRYGLWLDDELENGVSDVSVTFDNDPLADTVPFPGAGGGERKEEKIECIALEVWAVGVD